MTDTTAGEGVNERMASGYVIMHAAICQMAGTSGANARWYYDKANEVYDRIKPLHALAPQPSAGAQGEATKLLSRVIDTLKPFADVADKLRHCHVVEICEPHADNPSPNIVPLPREWFERAADDLEAAVIILHSEGVLSEGQASKMTGLGRVEVRKLVDATEASA